MENCGNPVPHVCKGALPESILVKNVHLGGFRAQLQQRLDAGAMLVLHCPLQWSVEINKYPGCDSYR